MRSTYSWLLRTRGVALTRAIGLVNLIGTAVRWLGLSVVAPFNSKRWAQKRDGMRGLVRAHSTAFDRPAVLRSHR
jgi:hypothetical protein